MAEVIDTYTREDGHVIQVYQSGAEYDRTAGRLVKPAGHTLITSENATAYNRRRQEKTSEALRAMVVESVNSGLLPAGVPRVNDSSEAIAAGIVMLLEQVTFNSEAYPRDRLAVLELAGRTTGDLADPRQPAPADDASASAARLASQAAAVSMEALQIMAQVWRDVKQAQASQPTQVIDSPGWTPAPASPDDASQPPAPADRTPTSASQPAPAARQPARPARPAEPNE